MTTFLWKLQGTTPTTIAATDILQFAGGSFNAPVFTGSYNDSMHVKSSGGSNLSAANTPRNNKFISQTGGTAGKSQVQVDGGATADLDTLVNANAAIKITVSDVASFATGSGKFFSYDGVTPATPAANIDVRAAEVGDSNFTQAEGSVSPLVLDDQVAATSHDFYIIISKSPSAIGFNSDKLRLELVIQ